MAANAEDSDHSVCVKCGSTSTLHCSACEYDEERGCQAKTRYCSKSCQAADWVEHKTKCLRIRRVNNLYRSVKSVQSVFYGFRKAFFDIAIKNITITPEKIVIREGAYGSNITLPFPDELIPDPRDQEAVLAHFACDDAVGWMHHFLEKLLEGTYQSIRELKIDFKNCTRRIEMPDRGSPPEVMVHGFPQPPQLKNPHVVLKVTVRGGPVYAVDIAGAQFGVHDPVLGWDTYADCYIQSVAFQENFGHKRGKLRGPRDKIQLLTSDPVSDAILGNQRMVVDDMEIRFDTWLSKHNYSVAKMLKMRKEDQMKALKDMADTLIGGMQNFAEKASTAKDFVVAVEQRSGRQAYPGSHVTYVFGNGGRRSLDELRKEGRKGQWQKIPLKDKEFEGFEVLRNPNDGVIVLNVDF
ncbi:uncharacterized protein AB675_461 [Cyphellophora attinorum]|uniref:MYND-type domain-containing protein n=1 Tax=Cyphellophora attinorum TaxID=1664694 RepID=A0A0N1HBS7_9EURO|nr:uncharacterized protein AB675_461 [Phialophora attinorum]KPI45722.1 hypothetical protein AB675_461 [Phialophora attinorum]